jgi:hypothetical protein
MASAPNGKKENILTSWKEIAAYLDRDVRTCVRWEKRYGLPVHRLERDSKAKVFAYKNEIDGWLASRTSPAALNPNGGGQARFFVRAFPVLFALAALAAAAYFLFLKPAADLRRSVPADFHIRGSELIIVDRNDREIWRRDTGLRGLENEDFYRGHFQAKQQGADSVPIWPYVMILDIDGDSRSEVLFCTQTRLEDREGTLICFDDRGTERWRFEAGRELDFGGKIYRKEYRIFGLNVEDYDGDGSPEILVISFHKPDWPCQAVMLDPAGKVEGEFWNAGYLMDASFGDVDGDGKKELVLSGVNNEYDKGCVAVFEAGALRGSSPQQKDAYRSPGLGESGSSAYILFPKSDVHEAIRLQGDPVNFFWIHEGGGLTADTYETHILYDLDRSLACRDVTLSNDFRNLHREFFLAGKVRSIIDAGYKEALKDSLLYFENGLWVGRPAPSPGARPATSRPFGPADR